MVNWPGGFHELFYRRTPDAVYFASRVALLTELWGYVPEADEQSVVELLTGGAVRSGATMFSGVRRVNPGSICRIGPDGHARAEHAYTLGAAERVAPDGDDVYLDLHRRTIAGFMENRSDVGVFLSGGIDSSFNAMCALDVAPEKTRLLTIGFEGTEFDETSVARDVARALGAESRLEVIPMGSADALDGLPQIIWAIEQPTTDYSIVPTSGVCLHCAAHTAAAMGGDGPDHLLGRKYGPATWDALLAALPGSAATARWLTASSTGMCRHALWSRLRRKRAGRQLWLALAAGSDRGGRGLSNVYTSLLYGPLAPSAVGGLISPALRQRTTPLRRISDLIEAPPLGPAGRLETYSAADASTDSAAAGVLAKIGKASRMAGLDLFEPYLSRPTVEYFWRLSSRHKLRGSAFRRLANRIPSRHTKLILRRLLARRVPQHVTDRSKQGFEPPLAAWLRQRLAGRTARHLCGSLLAHTDWLNETFVDRVIAEHVAGDADHRYLLFVLASLDQWHRAFIVGRGERPSWSWSDALQEADDRPRDVIAGRRSESQHEEAQCETG